MRIAEAIMALVAAGTILTAAGESRSAEQPGVRKDLAPVAAPEWARKLVPGTWAAVSKNTPADVDPAKDPKVNPRHPKGAPWSANSGQAGVIVAWNGGALATGYGAKGSLLLFGGGHSAYFGNEVYAFDLDSLLWKRATDPFPGPYQFQDSSEPYPEGLFPDGSPLPAHTYDSVEYLPGLNSFAVLKSTRGKGGTGSPMGVPSSDLLSLETGKWRRGPMNEKNHASSGAWSAYDSSRDVIWIEGGSGSESFACFDPKVKNADGTAGKWVNHPVKVGGSMDVVAAYDPVRDLIVLANFRSSATAKLGGVCVVDPKHPDQPAVQVSEEGARPPFGGKEGAAGWEWSPRRQSFLHWRRGAEVRECRPPAGDWKTGKWTWSTLTDAAANKGGPEKMRADNGVYSRFRVASYADAEVAVVINNVSGPVWAFRVPEAAGRGKGAE